MKITTDAKKLAKQIELMEQLTTEQIQVAVTRTAQSLRRRVVKNATSEYHASKTTRKKHKHVAVFRGHIPGTGPGPNARTGNYRRSIQVTEETVNGVPRAIVHTNAPQARRLEYGFRGTDSRGRTFNQPPYPHWEPAMDQVEPDFRKELRRAVRLAIENAKK